ncbi:hypothetical protein [Microbacterium sp. KR10-403]|uniref:hypothetical protein n=1 Tax=Microbacterium sp. KR10-403 TaxID=3158581 RepID=UPI0032E43BCC
MSIPIIPDFGDQVQTEPVATVPRRNRKSAKKAGSLFESVVANFLAFRLNDDRIERRARNGAKDRGDISGVKTIRGGRVVIEAKNVARVDLPGWLREAETEAGNDDAVIAVVAHKRRGNANPADQFVTMSLETFARLIEGGPDFGDEVAA